MFKLKPIALLLGCSVALSSYGNQLHTTAHGVSVECSDMTINVEVINESILHITKTKAGIAPDTLPDYVTVLEPQRTKWRCDELPDGTSQLTTAKLQVTIDPDGVIEYRNRAGKRLVSESREATWIAPESQVSQGFEAGDEAIYGLGQYQSGVMNLRSMPVHMDQFNQEIVVPFIISTNGYGIYWHNYSISDFNRPTKQLNFEDVAIDPQLEEKARAGVDAEDVANRKARKLKLNLRSIKFTPTQDGLYTFLVESDVQRRMKGDIKLIIDGDTIVNYSTIWVPHCHSGSKVLEAGREYEILFQNDGSSIAGNVLYNEPDFNKTTFTSSVGTKIEYYLVAGDNPQEILFNYHELTGRAPLFEKKSYGFWHCRERFHTQAELLENAQEYRKRNIPVDNIVQDWHYWPSNTKGPEWDRKTYPDPQAMTAQLDELNINLMVSVWPMINNKPVADRYNLTKYKFQDGSHYLDFYDEGVQRSFYRMLSDSMFRMGVKSIWLDGSEPEGAKISSKTIYGDLAKVTNPYSLLVSKSVYEGHREEFPRERMFNLTRSAYTGQQRYGVASWSGDVASTWEQFAEQIPAGLNFTMAGVPYWTHDIGGFFRDSRSMNPIYNNQYTNPEYIELLSRWFQFGAFSPIFRLHGYVSQTEVWRYGKDFEALARKYIGLRYALMPYIYSQAWNVTNNAEMMMSHLAYYYPSDKRVWEIKDQYIFGRSIMVCPVVDYEARSREVYLPAGEWYDFWSGKRYKGGESIEAAAPLDQLPLFVKAGSIIPMGGEIQYATEPNDAPIKVVVYPGADGEFTLYLDDNKSYDYEDGLYSEVSFTYDNAKGELTIASGHDKYTNFKKNPLKLTIVSAASDATTEIEFAGRKTRIELK